MMVLGPVVIIAIIVGWVMDASGGCQSVVMSVGGAICNLRGVRCVCVPVFLSVCVRVSECACVCVGGTSQGRGRP